ncbi:MAG: ComEC/Rec2 family competence protein [Flavobacteriaceae bacterium]
MTAPKFPIYVAILFFTCGMLISPWIQKDVIVWVLIIFSFFLALSKKYRVWVYLIFLPLGVLNHQQYYAIPSTHYQNYQKGDKQYSLLIKLTQALKNNDFQNRFYGKVIQINQKKSEGKILVSFDKETPKQTLNTGDLILTRVTPQPVLSRTNPGGFDYKKYLSRIKVYHQLKLDHTDFVKIKNQNKNLLDHLRKWNTTIEKKIDQSQLSQASRNIIKTLVLGKRDAIDRELVQAYANAGVIHLLAISGLHIGIIMLFLGFILKPIQSIPTGKWIYVISIVGLLWAFAGFAGGSPSIIRAVTMFTGLSIARYTHRIHNTFHLLMVSFFLLLIFYPPFLFQIGFQMSYLAVLGILKIHPMLQTVWQPRYIVLQKLWQITTVSLSAQIAVAPLSIHYFHQFPGLFMLSNWVILPFFGVFLIVSMGILALIGSNIELLFITQYYNQMVKLMNDSILWIAQHEGFLFKNMRLSMATLILIYTTMVFLFWAIKSRKMKYILVLTANVLILQIVMVFEQWKHSKMNQFWILYQHNKTIIAHYSSRKMALFSPQNISLKERFINDFRNEYPLDTLEIKDFKNTYISGAFRLLIIDQKKVYKIPNFRPTHLLISNDPKVNLDRILVSLNPKKVIVDGSNKPWNIARWENSCRKNKIPFVDLRKEGALPITL